jgi:hypothetical protein
MHEKENYIEQKERERHEMLAPLRGQQLKIYVNGIRTALAAERTAEKKAAYNEAVAKYVMWVFSVMRLARDCIALLFYCNALHCSHCLPPIRNVVLS